MSTGINACNGFVSYDKTFLEARMKPFNYLFNNIQFMLKT